MLAKTLLTFLVLITAWPSDVMASVPTSDDVIFHADVSEANDLSRIDPAFAANIGYTGKSDKWLRDGNRILVEVVMKFLGNLVPDNKGVEHPAPDENAIDFYTKRLGNSNFQFLLLGAGNLKLLGGPYLYSEIQGGVGVEYDFISPDKSGQGTLVAVRITPAYGEIAVIRPAAGATPDPSLPGEVLLGSSLGLEIHKRMGLVEPGLSVSARAEWEANGRHETGMGYYAAIYCKFHLKDLTKYGAGFRGTLDLVPVLAYYDRGGAKDDLYAWNRDHSAGDFRTVGELRRLWEAQVKLEVKF